MYAQQQVKEHGPGVAATEMGYPQHNYLLAALPSAERARLLPALRRVYLPPGSVLYESGDRLCHIYFPTDCVVSLLQKLHDGASAGIATIGNEGAVGVELLTGGETTTNRAVVQCAGFAYRLTAEQLEEELLRHEQLFQLLLRCMQAVITQIAQTVGCNKHHSVDRRLCRWLLESLDRVPSNKLTMTQDLIAQILGTRRQGVTVAARTLQIQGIINYRRGQITVLDRCRLEQLSCECYAVVKTETERLLPRIPYTASRFGRVITRMPPDPLPMHQERTRESYVRWRTYENVVAGQDQPPPTSVAS